MSQEPIPGLYELREAPSRSEIVDRLAAIPARLLALTAGADHEQLVRKPSPGEWCAFEVLCHMRDIVMVYGLRFRWMAFDHNPLLPNYDEDRWVAECRDGPDDLEAMLKTIAAGRDETSRMLRRLTDGQWARTGRHEILGEVELEPYVRHQLAHEELHLAQIADAMGSSATNR